MGAQYDLSGLQVLLTRPAGQSDSLSNAIKLCGGSVCELPLIEIDPVTEPDECERIKSRILNLDQYSVAIFISTNAARLGMSWIDRYWPQLPTGLSAYAVGPGTAAVLREFNWPVYCPDQGVTSEHLLALPGLKNVTGQRVALFRGVGGREMIAETLRERGAQVDYIELYRRRTPDYSADIVAGLVRNKQVNALVVTSAQILDVLLHFVHHDSSVLGSIPLIVPSARVGEKALQAGFSSVIDAGGASDAIILESLGEIAKVVR